MSISNIGHVQCHYVTGTNYFSKENVIKHGKWNDLFLPVTHQSISQSGKELSPFSELMCYNAYFTCPKQVGRSLFYKK